MKRKLLRGTVNGKTTIALALSAVMTMGMIPSVYAADVSAIKDMPNGWARKAVEKAVENDMLTGYEGYVRPDDNITRAEVSVVFNKILGTKEEADISSFADVNETDWFYSEMAKIVNAKIMSGDGDKLMPQSEITRQELFVLVARVLGLSDGNEDVLSSFGDSNEIADWAKGGIAALVEAGYVSGSDGELNPSANMTRAEFAQVLSNIAEKYIVSGGEYSENVDGNIFVSADGVTISGKINGNVIIGDGVKNVTFKDAEINGDVIVRGNGTSLEGTTVNGNLVINGINGTPEISVDENSSVGGVNAKSDYSSEKTFENAAGEGKNVYSPKSDDENADNTDNTETKDTPKSTSGGGGGGSSSSGGSSSNGGSSNNGSSDNNNSSNNGSSSADEDENKGNNGNNSSDDDKKDDNNNGSDDDKKDDDNKEEQAEIVNAAKAEVLAEDVGTWLPLVFNEGFNAENVTVTVDGKDVTSALSNVTTDGSIAKLPLVSTPKTVEIKSDNKVQTITLKGNGEGEAVYEGQQYLPDYVLTHGPIPVWDYYLTNYDEEGNVRIHPSKTTFSLTEEAVQHPSYSPDTELDENGDGEVVIMFNYNTDEEKEWFDGVNKLELVQYNENRNTINSNLSYELEKDVPHGRGKVGELKVPFGQSNFTSNGRYYVRVKSANGTSALVPIHVVNYEAPEISLKETALSGRNLHMQVDNMTYGITVPIERVTLTDPTGETRELEKIRDWYLIGDLFVLYNDVEATDGRNNIEYNGNYTITVYSNGFKTVSKTFNVTGGKDVEKSDVSTMSFDAVTRATSSGGGSGSGSDGSGSTSIGADLMFDSDLLANALILNDLQEQTEAVNAVVDYWYGVIYDSVLNKGETTYYTWTGYLNAVNDAKVAGNVWAPFAEYIKGNAKTTPNRPYALKEILEDGLLGDIQNSNTYGRLDAPKAEVSNNTEGNNVVLTFADKEYLSKVNALYLNGDWQPLAEDKYEIDLENGTVTILANLKIGDNKIILDAPGYVSNEVKFNYGKVNEENLSLEISEGKKEGEEVVITVKGSEGDFLKNLKSIVLNKGEENEDTVWAKGVEGSDAVYYTIADDKKSITLHNVKAGVYTVTITADYYEDALTGNFEVGEKETPVTPELVAPTYAGIEYKDVTGIIESYKCYRVSFGTISGNDLKKYLSAVNKVTVNGTAYAKSSDLGNNTYRPFATDTTYGVFDYDVLDIDANGLTGSVKVVISAEGYDDVEFEFTANGGSTVPTDPTEKAAPKVSGIEEKSDYYVLSFDGTDSEKTAYLDKIKSVKVGDTTYEKGIYFPSEKTYVLSGENSFSSTYTLIQLGKGGFNTTGATTITITSEGYADLTYTYNPKGSATDPSEGETKTAPTVTGSEYKEESSFGTTYKYYRVSFGTLSGNDLKEYLNKVTSVTVNGTEYTNGRYSFGEGKFRPYVSSTAGSLYDYDILDIAVNKVTENATVVIKADGYADVTFEITPEGGSTTPTEPSAKAAPTITSAEYKEDNDYWAFKYYRISFGALSGDDLTEYLNKITSVTVNETDYPKATSNFSFGEGKFRPNVSSDSGSMSDYDVLDIGTNKFTESTTIVIKADGYADLTYTYSPVSTNELVTEEVPVETAVEFAQDFMENTDHMSSANEAESVEDFLNSITNVSADENAAIGTDNATDEEVVADDNEAVVEETTEATEETVSEESTFEGVSSDNSSDNSEDTQETTEE